MHIGLCSPQWPPSGAANGIVSYVSVVRDYMLSQGHEVSIIAESRLFDAAGKDQPLLPTRRSDRPVKAWFDRVAGRLGDRHGGLPGVGRMVAEQVSAARRLAAIDLIEMEESFGWSDIVRRNAGIPVVTRLHGPLALRPPRQRTRAEQRMDRQRIVAEGRALRSSPSLTSPTRAIMGAACDRYGIGQGGLRAVIPNPIVLPAPSGRWRMGGCDPNHILMIGRFDHWKGADTILAAFDRLLDWRPEARLTLVGPDWGIETAPGQASSFDAYVSSNLPARTRERVTFTGVLTPDQIGELRRSAYVTVIASRWESYCYALVEGLAAGCPTISTAWDGSDEIVEDGVSGLLTPVGDAEALARKIDWLMARPEAACRIAENGFQRCRDKFSAETVGAELLLHYEATLQAAVSR